ncbi:MAG: hypothetical protein JSS83_26840 [Cyanobacteria bacterium SZAS LIN-3]|nr:hypothetical protein [Cyanobacteria bacterium SZAS LIN-3]MBS2006830.1 hypothetical protein [Cyanobacteria bacterium SZAS TMP-1]
MQNDRSAVKRIIFALPALYALAITPVFSYPEYQEFVEKHSHRTANCAMCHVNENGPVGEENGQLSALTADEFKRLSRARGALEPGQDVDSPILNKFGNEIIKTIGKKKFVELKSDPAALAGALGNKSDLDEDGISDATEYLDGTDPLNKFHGDPIKLFSINLSRYKMHVVLTIVAVLALNYGLINLIKAISLTQSMPKRHE